MPPERYRTNGAGDDVSGATGSDSDTDDASLDDRIAAIEDALYHLREFVSEDRYGDAHAEASEISGEIEGILAALSVTVEVNGMPVTVPKDVATVGEFREFLDLDSVVQGPGRTEVRRILEPESPTSGPGIPPERTEPLGEDEEPIVLNDGDQFVARTIERSGPPRGLARGGGVAWDSLSPQMGMSRGDPEETYLRPESSNLSISVNDNLDEEDRDTLVEAIRDRLGDRDPREGS